MAAAKKQKVAQEMWNCPVCQHEMLKSSAGRRPHMLRHHAELCRLPCTVGCAHGCRACVPDAALNEGKPADPADAEAKAPAPPTPSTPAPKAAAKSAAKAKAKAKAAAAKPAAAKAKAAAAKFAGAKAKAAAATSAVAAPATPAEEAAPASAAAEAPSAGAGEGEDHALPRWPRHSLTPGAIGSGVATKRPPVKGILGMLKKVRKLGKRKGKKATWKKAAIARPPGAASVAEAEWAEGLPPDLPEDHLSRTGVIKKVQARSGSTVRSCLFFLYEGVRFEVTELKAKGAENAGRIARLCYFMDGKTLDEVRDYRNQLYASLGAALDPKKQRKMVIKPQSEALSQSGQLLDLASGHARPTAETLKGCLVAGMPREAVLRGVDEATQLQLRQLLQEVPAEAPVAAQRQKVEIAIAPPRPPPPEESACALPGLKLDAAFPPQDFQLGVVLGESGSGVTQLLLELSRRRPDPEALEGPVNQEVFSDEAVAALFEDCTDTLPMVGLNNIPAWCRPYQCLSNGQQSRVRLALQLRSNAVIDDFGSGVDVQEIHSMANAIGKWVRRSRLQRVLIGTHCPTCVAFFQPDFVVRTDGSVKWNPNPADARQVRLRLTAGYMGPELAKGGGDCAGPGSAYTAAEGAVWHKALHVRREVKSVNVQLDKRTLDAAAAFEFPFEGTAECLIPVLPETLLPASWTIGLIVGPSGTGKTTTIRKLCEAHRVRIRSVDELQPDPTRSVWVLAKAQADSEASVQEVLEACQVPAAAWLRLFGRLSRSEAWRVCIALSLLQCGKGGDQLLVVDEFTTQLDRAHAFLLCRSLASYLRVHQLRAVLATVHTDVAALLRPEWVFDTGNAEFATLGGPEWDKWQTPNPQPEDFDWKVPELEIQVQVVARASVQAVWKRHFKDHHYLTGSLGGLLDGVFIAQHQGCMAAFHAVSMQPGLKTYVREHRLVVRPEFQGFGLGPRLSEFLAQRWLDARKTQDFGFSSKTAHPRLGEFRQRSPLWRAIPTANLQVSSGSEFGKLGFEKRRERGSLAHGTELAVRTLKGSSSFSITVSWPKVTVPLAVELTRSRGKALKDNLPFKLQGLNVTGVTQGFRLPEGINLQSAQSPWMLERVNDEVVRTQDDLSRVLRKYAHVESAVLYQKRKIEHMPRRSTEEEAQRDLHFLKTRLGAAATLDDELCQVRRLCTELIRAQKSAEDDAVVRPNVSEVPLRILPELEEASSKSSPAERKDRLCYSHEFVGHATPPETQWVRNDQYQAWMRIRVPELKSQGKTHSQCIEQAREDFHTGNMAVARIPSACLAACGPGTEKDAVFESLGLSLDSELNVLAVQDSGPVAKCGVNLKALQFSWRAVALRRGERKHDVSDLAGFLECLASLLRDADASPIWIYLSRRGAPRRRASMS